MSHVDWNGKGRRSDRRLSGETPWHNQGYQQALIDRQNSQPPSGIITAITVAAKANVLPFTAKRPPFVARKPAEAALLKRSA
jgi:hypothetical protein